MAGNAVPVGHHSEGRRLGGAPVVGLPAAGAEPAAGRRVGRAGHLAAEQDPLPGTPGGRAGIGTADITVSAVAAIATSSEILAP
jgi:hypothetical protein